MQEPIVSDTFDEKYLYIIKYLDKKISQYLLESQEALNFYYTVLNKQTGIKVSFVFIYLVIVSLLLFLSISIAIRFSSRFFRSINNLIIASSNIGKGNLDIKVPEIRTDKDMELLNQNFNSITSKNTIKKITRIKPKLSTTGGTSDARFIRKIAPCLEFGLVGKTMHKIDESVPLSDLKKLTNIYLNILENYFKE